MAEEKESFEEKLKKARLDREEKKQLDEILAKEKEEADIQKRINMSLEDRLKMLGKEFAAQSKLNQALKSTELSAKNISNAIISYNKSQVQFQKSLGISVKDSTKLTRNISLSALGSKNLGVSFIGTQKAIGNINKSLGLGSNLIQDQAEAAGRFAVTLGMSETAQNNLAKRSIQTGKSVESLVLSQVKVAKGVEAEFGARLNIAEVIDEAASISGQMRAQMGGNVTEMTRAVGVAKELGFELKAIAGTSKALLDFQSNIEAELEAELLTGRQLNLEQARLYALTGDYEGLTREIADNVGDFYEFSKLNVLQQDAIAKSVGMTTDQLSDQLFNQASIVELKEKARAEGDKETLQNLENLDIQKQFEQLVLKIKGGFVAAATALRPIGEIFMFASKHADLMLAAVVGLKVAMGALVVKSAVLAVNKIFATSFSTLNPLLAGGLAAAGVAALTSNVRKAEARAIGAPIAAGQPYMVGERGPELIVPSNSGTVIPNNQLSGGGGRGRSDEEIVSLAARSISVNFDTVRFNNRNELDSGLA